TVAQFSEMASAAYKAFVRPWMRALITRDTADALAQLHPLRLQRQLMSDANPLAWWIGPWAQWARGNRNALDADHPLRTAERRGADAVAGVLDSFRDIRDEATRLWARWFYGPQVLGALLPPERPAEERAIARADAALAQAREDALQTVRDGGFAAAV